MGKRDTNCTNFHEAGGTGTDLGGWMGFSTEVNEGSEAEGQPRTANRETRETRGKGIATKGRKDRPPAPHPC